MRESSVTHQNNPTAMRNGRNASAEIHKQTISARGLRRERIPSAAICQHDEIDAGIPLLFSSSVSF